MSFLKLNRDTSRPAGSFDTIFGLEASGWIFDSRNADKPKIEVLVDDRIIATAWPTVRRPDVQAAGFPTDLLGFSVSLPHELVDRSVHKVSVRSGRTGMELENSPKYVSWVRTGNSVLAVPQSAVTQKNINLQESALRKSGAIDLNRAITGGILLYAVYSEAGIASPTIKATADSFRQEGYTVIIINNCIPKVPLDDQELRRHADLLICRQSSGRDFGAWFAVAKAHFNDFAQARELVLINDSLVGPIRPLSDVIGRFRASSTDLWGLSESYDYSYHLQSSFLGIRGSFFGSSRFSEFLNNYTFPEDKTAVIMLGEISLTQHALSAGAAIGCLCPYDEVSARWLSQAKTRRREVLDFIMNNGGRGDAILNYELNWLSETEMKIQLGKTINPQHYFWDLMVTDFNYPFLKRQLLTHNPESIPILHRLWDTVGNQYIAHVRQMIEYELKFGASSLAPPPAPVCGRPISV